MNEVEIVEGREVWPVYRAGYGPDDKTIKSYCARFNNLNYEKAAMEVAICERFGNMHFDSFAPYRENYAESLVSRNYPNNDADYEEKELEATEKAKKGAIKKALEMEVKMNEKQMKLTIHLRDCLKCEIFERCIAISRMRQGLPK